MDEKEKRSCTTNLIWELRRHIMLWLIGEKQLMDILKGLWSRKIEAAVQA